MDKGALRTSDLQRHSVPGRALSRGGSIQAQGVRRPDAQMQGQARSMQMEPQPGGLRGVTWKTGRGSAHSRMERHLEDLLASR